MVWRRTVYLCDGRCGLVSCARLAHDATEILAVQFGQTTQDGRIRLSTLRCPERADHPLVVMIDDDSYLIENPQELRDLIDEASTYHELDQI
jgi:NADH:ubiquinone oxidoreductase subunit E